MNGKADFAKGSYYNNPIYNVPTQDPNLIQAHPEYFHSNIWPNKDLPELETAFMDLGKLIVDTGVLLARRCDMYLSKKMIPQRETIENLISNSKTIKARLLHYFPLQGSQLTETEDSKDIDSWCGWHLDHSIVSKI